MVPPDGAPAGAPAAPANAARQRIVFVLLLVAIVGLSALIGFLRSNRGGLEALAAAACRGDVAAQAQLRTAARVVTALVPTTVLLLVAGMVRVGRRARAEGVFPPPGAWVLRPARTFTGDAARRMGFVCYLFAIVLAGLALLLAALGLRILMMLPG